MRIGSDAELVVTPGSGHNRKKPTMMSLSMRVEGAVLRVLHFKTVVAVRGKVLVGEWLLGQISKSGATAENVGRVWVALNGARAQLVTSEVVGDMSLASRA